MRPAPLNKPRLRQSFAVEVVEPNLLFLLSEHRQSVFEGGIYPALVPHLQGRLTIGEIFAALAARFSLPEVFIAINRLTAAYCLVEGDTGALPEHARFWDGISVESDAVQVSRRLDQRVMTVRTLGTIRQENFEEALRQNGLRVGADGDLLVVATDDYLRDELAEIDRHARLNAKPWVLVKPTGMIVWIGPFFRPPDTACWHCLERRLRYNRQVELFIRRTSNEPIDIAKTRLPSIERSALNLAAIEFARLLSVNSKSKLEERVFTLDFLSYQIDEHILVRRPQCKECGKPTAVGRPGPMTLTSRVKLSRGSERTASADEVFARYKNHISPITGVVTSLVTRDLEACGLIHNYVASHYFPVLGRDVGSLQVNLIARSGGKGSTESQAKAGAVAESLERYSGIRFGEEFTLNGSFASLQPEAINIEDVVFFSRNQYADRFEWNSQQEHQKHYVPQPFNEQAEIAWTPLWSLTHDRVRYLPTAYCYYGHTDPAGAFCFCDSNGCAAGNTLEEAIVQGFIELAERDAVAIWWYNRLRRPAVDAASFDVPYWETLRSYYEKELQRDLYVIDITSDLGIATFFAVSRHLNQPTEDIIIGIGSSFNPRTALMQALLETNQSVPLFHLVTTTPALRNFCPRDVLQWLETATFEKQPYLVPDPALRPRTYSDFRQFGSVDVREDVLACIDIAKSCGLELLVLDQTRPDIGMPVARVVVPGLRHFRRRLAPGRLYEVPKKMGWLREARREEEMNPIPFFI